MSDPKLRGGTVPVTKHQPSDFDKLVGDNIHRAVIGTPSGDGVVPLSGNTPLPANVLEIPAGTTPQQAALLQSAFKSIMEGKALTVSSGETNAVAQPPMTNRDAVIPDGNTRMWNPYQQLLPTTKLTDMERTVAGSNNNPTAVVPGAVIPTSLKTKVDCSPVLVDAYNLINILVTGNWLIPSCPHRGVMADMLQRLKMSIEE